MTPAERDHLLRVRIPLAAPLPSLANARLHWSVRARKVAAQRRLVAVGLLMLGRERPALPAVVTLTRVSPRQLDDDNLASAFKAARDQVAQWLGVDDRPGSGVTWAYAQRSDGVRVYALEIEINPMEPT